MKRALRLIASVTGVFLIGISVLFLWAASGRLSSEERAQIKQYPTKPSSPQRDTFTVMSYDLGYLDGFMHDNSNGQSTLARNKMDQVARIIEKGAPDILGVQQVSFGEGGSAPEHQLDTIARRLGYATAAQAVNWDKRFVPFSYGPTALERGGTVAGQAVLSRFPIRKHSRRELPHSSEFSLQGPFSRDQFIQVVAVDIGGWPLLVMNVHLEKNDADLRQEQARTINGVYKRLAREGFPILLLGNFNSVRPTVPSVGSSIDRTMELLVNGTDLRSAFPSNTSVTGASVGTYPADNPNVKIDYIYYRPRYIVPVGTEILCGDTPPPSDHCAIAMTFLLPRPKERLPDMRIPDEQLPSLDSLMSP